MRRNAVDSPKVAREKIEHPQMSPLHEMKTASDPDPAAKDSFDGGGLFPGVDRGMDFNWSGEVSEEKLQIARDMYAQLPDAYKQGDAGDRQVVSGFMALVMGVVAMFRVGKIAPKRAMDAAMGIATMEAMAKKTRQMQMQQQLQLGGPDAVVVSAAQYQALVKRVDDLEAKVAALASGPPEVPPELEESIKAAAARVDALETELDATKKLLETSSAQQEEVLSITPTLFQHEPCPCLESTAGHIIGSAKATQPTNQLCCNEQPDCKTGGSKAHDAKKHFIHVRIFSIYNGNL